VSIICSQTVTDIIIVIKAKTKKNDGYNTIGGIYVDLYNQTQSRDSPEPELLTWLKLSVCIQ